MGLAQRWAGLIVFGSGVDGVIGIVIGLQLAKLAISCCEAQSLWGRAVSLKHSALGAMALTLMSAAANAQSTVEKQWGGLIDDIAALTWAEKNCSGRASDGVRELRLYFRKHIGPEFEEALIRVETDKRESIEGSKPYVDEPGTVRALCIGMSLVWGDGGRLPGLWKDNRSRSSRPGASNLIYLPVYGQFASVLSLIDQMKSRCRGYPSALAHEFTRAFIAGAGEKAFKERAQIHPSMSQDAERRVCEAIDNTYGPNAKEWPTLWYDPFRAEPAPHSPSAALDKQNTSTAVGPAAPSSSFTHGVLRRTPGSEAIAPFSVKTSPGATYFIKLVRPSDNREEIAGFIVGGQPFSTTVPIGTYELRYATGQVWIDEHEYFGPKTVFYKADRLLVFSIEGDRVRGSEIELIPQRGGNLRTSTIRKDKF
jgi:hypothetical protein